MNKDEAAMGVSATAGLLVGLVLACVGFALVGSDYGYLWCAVAGGSSALTLRRYWVALRD